MPSLTQELDLKNDAYAETKDVELRIDTLTLYRERMAKLRDAIS